MNLSELHDELERLGRQPVPVFDLDRVDALEERLLDGFWDAISAAGPVPVLDAARRRRRQVLVATSGAAAAALVTAMVVARSSEASYEVSAAIGAVAMYPDGGSQPVEAGDRVPAGGLIRTGPAGAVTIEDTTVGADRVVLLDEEHITLLPAPPASPPAQVWPPAVAATQPPVTLPPSAPPAAAPVTLVPTFTTPASPVPAAVDPAPLGLTGAESPEGAQLSWTPSDAPGVERYIIVRGTADSDRLVDIAELGPDQTMFTDTTPPAGVELCYKVVAVGADGLPIAISDTITLLVEGTGSSNEIPPSTHGSPTTQPGPTTTTTTTTTTAPPASVPPSTTVVETTVGSTVPATAPTTAGEPAAAPKDHLGADDRAGPGHHGGNEDWDQDGGG